VSQPRPIERLGIAGSGAVARGLAKLAADHGEVVLWARSDESAERANDSLGDCGAQVVTALEDLAGATLVVEAVAEEHAVKAQVYERLAPVLPDETILATTTSSLSVAGLAGESGRPERFAAIHVFNPVERMELVELAFPPQASDDTRRRVHEWCEALDKVAVEVPDVPGFVVNRLLFPYLFSAVRLLEESGLDAEAVDTCMKLGAAHPMGPLALLDFVGLDVAIAIGEQIGTDVPERVRSLAADGKLGKKTGAGFYEY
jgi:3-hydroxybutyryl-CoA dehydrogenase